MRRISTRFALMMAAAAVVPLLAYGAVSIISVGEGAEQAVIQGNQNVATRAGGQIERYVLDSIRILNAVAQDLRRTDLKPWQQEKILLNFASQFGEYKKLILLDENGKTIASSGAEASDIQLPGADSVTLENALISRFTIDDDLFRRLSLPFSSLKAVRGVGLSGSSGSKSSGVPSTAFMSARLDTRS